MQKPIRVVKIYEVQAVQHGGTVYVIAFVVTWVKKVYTDADVNNG